MTKFDGSGGRQRCGECPLEENKWPEANFRVEGTHRDMVEFCVCIDRVSEVGTRQKWHNIFCGNEVLRTPLEANSIPAAMLSNRLFVLGDYRQKTSTTHQTQLTTRRQRYIGMLHYGIHQLEKGMNRQNARSG